MWRTAAARTGSTVRRRPAEVGHQRFRFGRHDQRGVGKGLQGRDEGSLQRLLIHQGHVRDRAPPGVALRRDRTRAVERGRQSPTTRPVGQGGLGAEMRRPGRVAHQYGWCTQVRQRLINRICERTEGTCPYPASLVRSLRCNL